MPIVFDEVVGNVEENRSVSRENDQPAAQQRERQNPVQPIPAHVLKAMIYRLQQRLERLIAD